MRSITAIALMATLVLAYGCAQKAGNESQYAAAGGKAEGILQGISTGDYAMFSSDLSDSLRQSMDEVYLSRLNRFVKANSGDYISKALATSKDEGKMRALSYDAQFSLEQVYLTITFNEDYSMVEGVYLDSANMRRALSAQ